MVTTRWGFARWSKADKKAVAEGLGFTVRTLTKLLSTKRSRKKR